MRKKSNIFVMLKTRLVQVYMTGLFKTKKLSFLHCHVSVYEELMHTWIYR